ncbi:unnamed protein product [Rhodiola kirilowii]
MQDEMDALKKNKTWEIVERPPKARLVGSKWIFIRNEGIPDVETPRRKAKLVARGFTQKEGIDFNEIFSPNVKHRSIRIMLSLVAYFDYEVEQLDVKTTFLHGKHDETIYMRHLEGFVIGDPEKKVSAKKVFIWT